MATPRTSTAGSMLLPCDGAKFIRSTCLRIPKRWRAGWPFRPSPASKRPLRNKLLAKGGRRMKNAREICRLLIGQAWRRSWLSSVSCQTSLRISWTRQSPSTQKCWTWMSSWILGWIVTFAAASNANPQVSVATEGGSGTSVPDLSVEVDNFDEVLLRLRRSGSPIEYGPLREPWGVKRSFVRDPFGRLLNILAHE